uniref:Uncharacterized protein n=1 Tax=Globodera rostochiensis TaxID=31243 RepID=A0A914HJH2_GLORO
MSYAINTFKTMLEKVNEFPFERMDELLKRRLQEPLENAISNCEELDEKVKQSGLKDKKDLDSLLTEILKDQNLIDECKEMEVTIWAQ